MSSDPYADWALVVVDVQQGFDDPFWGVRNNPDGDRNIAALVDDWASHGRPLVFVRHDSVEGGSPLDPGTPGNELKPYLKADPDLARTGPDGHTLTADELARATATNLHGEFATVTSTAELLAGTARPLD